MSDQPEAFRLIDTFVSRRDLAWHVSASAELRRLHEENEKLNADIESLRMTLAAATTLGEKVTAENERLRAELAEANAVRERCNERAFRLESEVERLRDAARQMQAGAEK